ncbi:MAG: DUF177 domain-containing protein [Oligoflexia bacterium]|nr:DUF177 domain-containing protein [Oligoflexia bacterium]
MSAAKDLKLKFHEIPQGGLDFDFSQKTGELNTTLFDLLGDYPVYQANIHISPADSLVQVRGKLTGELRHICSRCAEDFSSQFSKNFVTNYYKSEDNISGLTDSIDDLDGSFDLEFLEGNEINLAEAVHEQVALEIPFQPLCTEECKGLCLKCGSNLNLAQCLCKHEEVDQKVSPFAKLKELKGE